MPLLSSWGLAGPRPRPRLAVVAAAAATAAAAAVAAAAEFGGTTPQQIITLSNGEHGGPSIGALNEGRGGSSLGYPAVSEERRHSLDGQLTIPPVFPPPESLAIDRPGDLLAGVEFANEEQQVTRESPEQQHEQRQEQQERQQEQQEGGEAVLEEGDGEEERLTADTAQIPGPRLRVRGLLGLVLASSLLKYCWKQGGLGFSQLTAAGFGFAAVAFMELLYTLFDHFYRKRRQFRAARNAVLGSAPSNRRTIIKENLRKYEYPLAGLSHFFLFLLPPIALGSIVYCMASNTNASIRGQPYTFYHPYFVLGALAAALIYALRKEFDDAMYKRRMKKRAVS